MTRYKIVSRRKLAWVRTADRLLALAGGAGPAELPAAPARILAVRLAYTGDALMTLPALAALRARYPAARLDFLTGPGGDRLFAGQSAIDRVIVYRAPWFFGGWSRAWPAYRNLIRELRGERYDLAFDFRGDIRNIAAVLAASRASARIAFDSGGGGRLLTHPVPWERPGHKVDYHLDLLRALGIDAPSADPRLELDPAEVAAGRDRLAAWGLAAGAFVAVHPGSRVRVKRWPAERFAHLAAELRARGLPVAVIGAAAERRLAAYVAGAAGAVNLAGQLDLRELAVALHLARAAVANDSAPMHLAAAVGTPVLGIFGPSKPDETAPRGPRSRALAVPVECRSACDESRCTHPAGPICLAGISIEAVLAAVLEILG